MKVKYNYTYNYTFTYKGKNQLYTSGAAVEEASEKQNISHLNFAHAVGHRVPIDTLDVRSQTFTLKGCGHVDTLLPLTDGQHTPPQHTWDNQRKTGTESEIYEWTLNPSSPSVYKGDTSHLPCWFKLLLCVVWKYDIHSNEVYVVKQLLYVGVAKSN